MDQIPMSLDCLMPPMNCVIPCISPNGEIASLLPQSEKLLYHGKMLNILDSTNFGLRKLVHLYKTGFSFRIIIDSEMQTSMNELSFRLILYDCKYNPYKSYFHGMCYKDAIYDAIPGVNRWFMIYHDDRTWRWKCIQRFFYTILLKKKIKRRLALAMALHSRLGECSTINHFPMELLAKCVD